MAYDASGLSVLVNSLMGIQRVWGYRTTDALSTVDDTDYFASAATERGVKAGDACIVFRTDSPVTYYGYFTVDGDGNATFVPAEYVSGMGSTVAIGIAASATTDGMDITITVRDAAGETVAAVHQLEIWMSEAATGIGLTGDTYSGDLTATAGAILSAHTAKKHWSVVTAATGIFSATLVDSANPADQYVVAKRPLGAGVVVSAVSGTNWQGA